MSIPENIANHRFAIQGAQGTPAASSAYAAYLAGGSQVGAARTDEAFEETTGQRMRSDRYVSEAHAAGAPEFYVMPKMIAPLLYGVLGAKAVSGVGDPYTHTLTPATSRPWLTFWRSLGALIYEESSDCKIDQLVISGESGKPLRAIPSVQGLTPKFQTTEETTASVEVADRILYYDGDGALKLEGSAVASIRAFTLTISNNSEIVPGDNLNGIDISEGELTVQLTITKLLLTASMRNRLYYGTASPSNDTAAVATILELGSSGADFKFTRAASPERSLQIQIPRVTVAPYDVQPGTGNSPLTEGITLEALQPASGASITGTVLNSEASIA